MNTMNKYVVVITLGLSTVLLNGCAKDVVARGNLPKPEMLAQLSVGEQTRQDVQAMLGTPAATSVFDDERWYYISSHTTQYAFYPNHELDRTIYALSFDKRGILEDVRRFDLNDGQPIQVSGRETPTKGREYSFIEQLVGNIGRVGTPGPKE